MAIIQISNDPSGRIIVSFPYDPLLVEKVKSIDGRRWRPAEKHWSFPNTDKTLGKILKVFEGKEIQIDPVLQTQFSNREGTVPDLLMSRTKNNERCTMNKKFIVHGSSFKVSSVESGLPPEVCL